MRKSKLMASNYRNTGVYCTVVSSLLGLGVIFVCMFGFSAVVTKVDASALMITVLSTAALCVGTYVGGYICARKRRKNGLMMGIICGAAIFFAVLIMSLIFTKAALSFSAGGKLILAMVCAGIGGIIGVNSKGRKY
ncbi:MAG: TIGR04086 family membrane protein [Oscillospiraceae bacterium]